MGTDTECYCLCCEVVGRAIYRGTGTECYCVVCGSLGKTI